MQEHRDSWPKDKDSETTAGRDSLKEYIGSFKEDIETFQKNFLAQGREIDSLAKTRVFSSQCVDNIRNKFINFSLNYSKMYNLAQLEILEQNSNKKMYEKF